LANDPIGSSTSSSSSSIAFVDRRPGVLLAEREIGVASIALVADEDGRRLGPDSTDPGICSDEYDNSGSSTKRPPSISDDCGVEWNALAKILAGLGAVGREEDLALLLGLLRALNDLGGDANGFSGDSVNIGAAVREDEGTEGPVMVLFLLIALGLLSPLNLL
jgi:hypothetical protein